MKAQKRLYEPGEYVTLFNGLAGIVVSEDVLDKARKVLKEGHKPGRYFVPGCCQHPDYVIQVPVIFEDETFDVIRAMNLRKTANLPLAKKERIEGVLNKHGL